MTDTTPGTIIVAPRKSHVTGFLLTLFFGPLGLLYATPIGALVLIVLTVIVALFTLGIGAILGWLTAIVWSVIAIMLHNRRVAAAMHPETVADKD